MNDDAATIDTPDLSVVIVAHNERERVLDCLRSLADQRPIAAKVEILVVDDGSDDHTAAAVGQNHPGVRVIRKVWEGADLSRNRGIEESCGHLIAFLDADCIAASDWVESIVESLREEPLSVVGGRVVHRGSFIRRLIGIADFGEYQSFEEREAQCLPTCNLAASRSVLGRVRFDPRVSTAGGDTVFTESLRRTGAVLRYRPKIEVEHRPSASMADFMKRARRYGASFVRARQVMPTLRYAGLVRAGVPGVAVATVGRIVLDWLRLLRHRRPAGFRLWEMPAAAALLAARRLVSFPAAIAAVREGRGQPVTCASESAETTDRSF